METFFKKYFWIAQGVFVVAAAILLAGAVNGFVAAALTRFAVVVPEPPRAPEQRGDDGEVPIEIDQRLVGVPEPEAPLDRCLDVECDEDEECDPETGACVAIAAEQEVASADGRCIESDIAINLVGTMVASDASWSVAVLRNPSLNQTQFARVGQSLLTEAEITRIERGRIFFIRNGREECLRPGDQATRAARAAEAQARAAAAAPAAPSQAPSRSNDSERSVAAAPVANQTLEQRIASQIERNEDGSYSLPRDLIQEVANNSALMEQHAPRVVPNYENGQPVGFRLQSIRSGSIFSAIGIRNGDVIVGVNGTTIDSPQRALELYQALLQQNEVNVEIRRRGRDQTLRYQIQ
jgi:general secretion pathway protein C